jgi:hypothetical protein
MPTLGFCWVAVSGNGLLFCLTGSVLASFALGAVSFRFYRFLAFQLGCQLAFSVLVAFSALCSFHVAFVGFRC